MTVHGKRCQSCITSTVRSVTYISQNGGKSKNTFAGVKVFLETKLTSVNEKLTSVNDALELFLENVV